MRPQPVVASLLALAFSLALAGCAARDAQRAVQSSLTAVAAGVVAVDEIAAARAQHAAEAAREQVLQERAEAGGSGAVEDWLTRYDAILADWTALARGLSAARQALYAAQAALNLWVSTGELPEGTGVFCEDLEEAVVALGPLLEAVGVEMPAAYAEAAGSVGLVCTVVSQYARGE